MIISRQAVADAARDTVTQKWREMQQDDARLISRPAAGGASYSAVTAAELSHWKERTASVVRKFTAAHPEIMRKFSEVICRP
jgi:hypothetical protein